ncbi:MAG: hypothetical protein IH991_20445, partial [Planctomycetes bacterium]|nr:hypothetical protein [Planctomycetota bacterium]
TMRLFVDGILEVTATNLTVHNLPLSIAIGTLSKFNPVGNFSGLIDEVELFNRVLSDAEIWAIYSVGRGGKCKTPEACCFPDGPCQTVTPGTCANCCDDLDGTAIGRGTSCLSDPNNKGTACDGFGCCCLPDETETVTSLADCETLGGAFAGVGMYCDVLPECEEIPTVSVWGLLVMSLLALTRGTIYYRRTRFVG